MRIPVVCVVLLTACYSPTEPDCGFDCMEGACPTGYFCATDRVCHRNGTPDSLMCAGPDARPDTPRPIDAPPDTTGPELIVMMPMPFEQNVPVTSTVYIQFNEPVVNVNTSTFMLTSTTTIAGTVSMIDARTYTFAPLASLPPASTITVGLTSAITDQLGNPFLTTSYMFQTAP